MLYGIFGCQLLEIPRHVDVLCHVHESPFVFLMSVAV